MSQIQDALLRQQKREMLKLDLGSAAMIGAIILFVQFIAITGIVTVLTLIELKPITLLFAALTVLLAYNIRMCWRVFSQARAERASIIYRGIMSEEVLTGSDALVGGLSTSVDADGGEISLSAEGGELTGVEHDKKA